MNTITKISIAVVTFIALVLIALAFIDAPANSKKQEVEISHPQLKR